MSTNSNFKHTKTIAAVSLTVLLSATACSSGSTGADNDTTNVAGDAAAPEVSELTVAGYLSPSAAAVYAAQQAGIPEEYGITIDYQPGDSAPAMFAQLISGDIEVAQASAFYTIPAVLEGAEVMIAGEVVRGIPDTHTVEVLPDSGIETLKDLEGKKVAVLSPHSAQEARITSAMMDDGADPSKVEFVSLFWNEMPAALEQGNVDAVTITGPALNQVRQEMGTVPVLDLGDGDFADFPDSQWVVTKAWAEENPNALAALQCSIIDRGAQLVMDDQDAYEDALREMGLTDEAIAEDVKVNFPASNEPPQVIADLLTKLGWIDEEFDASTVTLPMPEEC